MNSTPNSNNSFERALAEAELRLKKELENGEEANPNTYLATNKVSKKVQEGYDQLFG